MVLENNHCLKEITDYKNIYENALEKFEHKKRKNEKKGEGKGKMTYLFINKTAFWKSLENWKRTNSIYAGNRESCNVCNEAGMP